MGSAGKLIPGKIISYLVLVYYLFYGGGYREWVLAAVVVVGLNANINVPLSLRGHSKKMEVRTFDPCLQCGFENVCCSMIMVVVVIVVWFWW